MEVKEKVQVNAVAVEEAVRMKTDVQVALELDNGLDRNRGNTDTWTSRNT